MKAKKQTKKQTEFRLIAVSAGLHAKAKAEANKRGMKLYALADKAIKAEISK